MVLGEYMYLQLLEHLDSWTLHTTEKGPGPIPQGLA